MPEITAQLNYLRIAPRKVRAAADLIRGLDADLAQARLQYLVRRPARPLLKLLNSAIANARFRGLDKDFLYIKEITVNEGMKLKRYKPKGFGLAMPIQKKTSHIKIVLDELSEERKKKKQEALVKRPKVIEMPSRKKQREEKKKLEENKKEGVPAPKGRASLRAVGEKEVLKKGAFGGIKQFGRRLFRRKAV